MRLNVESLETRETPAAFAYDAGTLTITATQDETIIVDAAADAPAGYLTASGGGVEFSSLDAGAGPVKNIVIDLSKAGTGGAILMPTVSLGGSLTVLGARDSSTLQVAGDVGKNVTFLGAADEEGVVLEPTAEIGGNLVLAMGGGVNYAFLRGGKVHGNLTYTGGSNSDLVELTADANVTVDGSASFKLGGGGDFLSSLGDGTFRVGGDLRVNLGGGPDSVLLNNGPHQTTLVVGGDCRILAGSGGGNSNEVLLGAMDVAGNLDVIGGADTDFVTTLLGADVGGSMTLALGDGDNQAVLEVVDTGGSLSVLGGVGDDSVNVFDFRVGRNLAVAAEEISLSGLDTDHSRVFGSLKLKSGPQLADVRLGYIDIGGKLALATGAGADTVLIDDINVGGTTLIALGLGTDLLAIDDVPAYAGVTTFGGAVTVKGGGDADEVHLAVDGNQILFGSSATFIGGGGTDFLNNSAANDFFGPDGSEDFETGNGVLLA